MRTNWALGLFCTAAGIVLICAGINRFQTWIKRLCAETVSELITMHRITEHGGSQ